MGEKTKGLSVYEIILWLWTFFSTSFVTYQMIENYDTYYYTSDYPKHIELALNGVGYSLTDLILQFCYIYVPIKQVFPIFSGIVVALTGIIIKKIFEYCIGTELISKPEVYVLVVTISYSFLFLSSIYIPNRAPFYEQRDLNNEVLVLEHTRVFSFMTQPWHNPTYLPMRLFGMVTILLFFKIWDSQVKKKHFIILLIALTLTNLFKPNFIVAFAPTVFIVLILEIIKKKSIKEQKNVYTTAIIIIISMIPLLYQYNILFSSNDDASITYTFDKIRDLIDAGFFVYPLIASFLFPLLVTILAIANRIQDNKLLMAWIFELITMIQSMFLIETGARMQDANFIWNLFFASLVLYIVCVVKMIDMFKLSRKLNYLYNMAWGILGIHLANSFMYFGLIFMGVDYTC